MGTQASKSNRTYFDLLPIELKEILLTYIPLEASEICDKESTFTNACSDEDYWEKLYRQEFSSFKIRGNRGYSHDYLLARMLWDLARMKRPPEDDLLYMITQGWDRKVIPLLEKMQLKFDVNALGYDLLKTAISHGNTPVVRYLVDIRGGDLYKELEWNIYYLSKNS